MMTPEQITLIKQSWDQARPFMKKAPALFYERLFELDPSLKPLFKGDLREQGLLLIGMINISITALKNYGKVEPVLEDMGRRHTGYGVSPAHYKTFGEALIWTLGETLEDDFTPQVQAAWESMYQQLTEAMIKGAQG